MERLPANALLPAALRQRLASAGPIRVALIGAGKFGSMFLAQLPTSPHIRLVAVCDRDEGRIASAFTATGLGEDMVDDVTLFTDATAMVATAPVEVVIDATGDPVAGVAHASAAIASGVHIVMANVEADVLAGPALAAEARKAGCVYSMAYGDQPALICELVDWARTCGFAVVAAGKGTRYQPHYHQLTPDDVWDHYGLNADQAAAAGMNPQMFNSFIDGTKSAIEMAAVANATGLAVPAGGLAFPPCPTGQLADVLRPRAHGGVLDGKGYVEVVASAARGADEEFADNLRWGVYVVIEAPGEYTRACFSQYGMKTDSTGRYSALYRPYHLIGLELNMSIVSAALDHRPTGHSHTWRGDVVACAKRDLCAGEVLDGEGGYTVWGKLVPAPASVKADAVPIGLANGLRLRNRVGQGRTVTFADVDGDIDARVLALRQRMAASLG